MLGRNQRTNYDYAVIAEYKPEPGLNGLSVVEAAVKRRGTASLENQMELIFELETHGGASAVFHGISAADLEAFLRHPNTMTASDSGVRDYQIGMPHPRGYGNNARPAGALCPGVEGAAFGRRGAAHDLAAGVRVFRLQDRGCLRPGAWADVVVFDPARVQDHATFREPHQYATGFAWVLVNGVAVVKNDAHTGARPGRALRHSPDGGRREQSD